MASAAQDGEDENYWPGFVDALTTMVMVLTFIMMILGMTVFSLSQNVSKAMIADIARSANVPIGNDDAAQDVVTRIVEAIAARNKDVENQERKARVAEAQRQIDERSQREAFLVLPGDRKISSAPADLKPLQAGAAAGANEVALTIVFQNNAALFDESVRRELISFAARARESEFVIRAYAVENSGTISESRRLAYYRAMLVRQEFVKAGLNPGQVTIQIDDSTDAASRSVVRVYSLRKTP
jgi:hypothetical protein